MRLRAGGCQCALATTSTSSCADVDDKRRAEQLHLARQQTAFLSPPVVSSWYWSPTSGNLLILLCLSMALWFSGIRRALSWNPYFSERSARSTRSLKLPDLFAPLGEGASSEFEINRHCKKVTDASEAWFREQCQLSVASTSSEKEEVQDSIDLKAGLLAAICFPAVDFGQLRLCADFLNWMLHFEYQLAFLDTAAARKLVQESLQLSEDPTSSVGESTGRALKRSVSFSAFPLCSFDLILIFSSILIRLQSKTNFFKRFSETLQAYVHVLDQQLQDRQQHVVPDIESYIALQREGGWPRLLFLLLECSQGLSTSEITWSKNRGLTQLTEAAADVLMYSTVCPFFLFSIFLIAHFFKCRISSLVRVASSTSHKLLHTTPSPSSPAKFNSRNNTNLNRNTSNLGAHAGIRPPSHPTCPSRSRKQASSTARASGNSSR